MVCALSDEALLWVLGNYYPEDLEMLKNADRQALENLLQMICDDVHHEPIQGRIE